MREVYGLDIAGRRSKHLDVFAGERFDEVVSLCDRLREACPELPGHAETVHWSMADPSEGHGDDLDAGYPAFRDAAAELDDRIGYLVGALAGRPTAA